MILFAYFGYCKSYDTYESRVMPAPFDSIFPNNQYPGPIIGAPDIDFNHPLTQEFWHIFPDLQDNRVKIYGWLDPSFNLSTSHDSNIPLAYNIVPNKVELDQLVLIAERVPDTVQTEHMDVGFRVANVFGIDYRYTLAQGVFSNQLYAHNNLYGDDPIEFLANFYFPAIKEGMLVTIGRSLSPVDLETIFAPYAPFLTHSVSLTYNAYTQTGINATVRYSPQWTMIVGINAGDDMAPWAQGAHPTLQWLWRFVAPDNNDSLIGGITSVNNGRFTGDHDNLQQFNIAWTHRVSETFMLATEAYYIYQFNAAKHGSCNFGPVKSYGDGGGCGQIISGLSDAIGVSNIIEKKILNNDFVAFRTDFFNDAQGQRTGYATPYLDLTCGLTHQFNKYWSLRPEIRYDIAFNAIPYDNGTKKTQTTFSIDTVIRF